MICFFPWRSQESKWGGCSQTATVWVTWRFGGGRTCIATSLPYSCLENPTDGGAWQAAVHGVTKSRTRLSDWTELNWTEYRRRQWQPTPVLLPGKSHGRRSLVGCSPWGHEESDMTERLHFSLSCIGEGNGNPLKCSCLENPRNGRAWWAAVYGVAQSRIQLKRLSSSSSNRICMQSCFSCVRLFVTL